MTTFARSEEYFFPLNNVPISLAFKAGRMVVEGNQQLMGSISALRFEWRDERGPKEIKSLDTQLSSYWESFPWGHLATGHHPSTTPLRAEGKLSSLYSALSVENTVFSLFPGESVPYQEEIKLVGSETDCVSCPAKAHISLIPGKKMASFYIQNQMYWNYKQWNNYIQHDTLDLTLIRQPGGLNCYETSSFHL